MSISKILLGIGILLLPVFASAEGYSDEIPEENNAKIYMQDDEWIVELDGHRFTIQYLIHKDDCDCQWWLYDY